MTTFLFWNLNGQTRQHMVANLAERYSVDVVLLAECTISIYELLSALNRSGDSLYDYAAGLCERIHVFSRFDASLIAPVLETDRCTIRHLRLPGLQDMLLAAAHLPSKMYTEEVDRLGHAADLANLVRKAEETVKHTRTVLVGDLNLNPFETGVVTAGGLHGVMCRRIAEGGSRMVRGKSFPFFYNPMWGLLGDASPGPPGTYFYDKGGEAALFWHTFDQVLIRPDLLDRFRNEGLAILDSDGTTSFCDGNGRPNRRLASDHLPILFSLEL